MTTQRPQNVGGLVAAPPSLPVDAARGDTPFQASPPTYSSVAWDPFGEGGIHATDHRFAWRDDARCYALLCESCHQQFAIVLDGGFYVCLGCRVRDDR